MIIALIIWTIGFAFTNLYGADIAARRGYFLMFEPRLALCLGLASAVWPISLPIMLIHKRLMPISG